MYILNKNKQGLTLIETLIAISILLMSAVMPMTIYSNSIVNARYASEQITATYLAQEAVELVKYMVDTRFNQGSSWFGNSSSPELPNCDGSGFGNVCTTEVSSGSICRGVSCSSMLYFDINNLYTHDNTGTPTKFSRTVEFDGNPNTEGALVSSTVTWKSGGKDRNVTVEEYVTKWR